MKNNEEFLARVGELAFIKDTTRSLAADGIKSTENMFHFGYKENDQDKFSSVMILRGLYKNHESPGYIMIGSLGAVLNFDIDSKNIIITFSKADDKEGFKAEFNADVEEGEFFQRTLIDDFRHVTFEHIKFLQDLVELTNEYELSIERS